MVQAQVQVQVHFAREIDSVIHEAPCSTYGDLICAAAERDRRVPQLVVSRSAAPIDGPSLRRVRHDTPPLPRLPLRCTCYTRPIYTAMSVMLGARLAGMVHGTFIIYIRVILDQFQHVILPDCHPAHMNITSTRQLHRSLPGKAASPPPPSFLEPTLVPTPSSAVAHPPLHSPPAPQRPVLPRESPPCRPTRLHLAPLKAK